ncbi:hypothetical protein NE237_016680 [Protea cynaroides]|uniref:Uncharacterized protein n=1 Tax=Protea cynaroides TaxID=273540 RepID=A0A9Q0K6E3_9MAGN|nr:hypothetical protein NE237_016680 [Protea cynaroides]
MIRISSTIDLVSDDNRSSSSLVLGDSSDGGIFVQESPAEIGNFVSFQWRIPWPRGKLVFLRSFLGKLQRFDSRSIDLVSVATLSFFLFRSKLRSNAHSVRAVSWKKGIAQGLETTNLLNPSFLSTNFFPSFSLQECEFYSAGLLRSDILLISEFLVFRSKFLVVLMAAIDQD